MFQPIWIPQANQILKTSALLTTLLLVMPAAAEAASFNRLFVLGDSLSDTGNTFAASSGQVPPPILPTFDPVSQSLVPVPAYFEGRFSNGPIWLDFLSSKLEFKANPINTAFAGSTTGTLNTTNPALPGLQQQVAGVLNLGVPFQSDDLFVVWAGNNDYLEISGQTNPNIPVNNLEFAIRSLATAGAQNFLVPNLPDLGRTPLVTSRFALDPTSAQNPAEVSSRVQQHNDLLASRLQFLRQDPSLDANLIGVDVFSLFDDAIANPTSFGLTNVNDACLFPSPLFFPLQPVTKCANPNEYLFWDSLHPSSQAHQFVADAAYAAIEESIPEPSTVLALGLMGGGFFVTRRMRQKAKAFRDRG